MTLNISNATHKQIDVSAWVGDQLPKPVAYGRPYAVVSKLADYVVMDTAQIQRQKGRRLSLLGLERIESPYMIGLGGSVASGKSVFVEQLAAEVKRQAPDLRVEILSTDGFLLSNRQLEEQGLTSRKGFPESYDREGLLRFVQQLNLDEGPIEYPVYSHQNYDVSLRDTRTIDQPDIVILEGLNVLQTGRSSAGNEHVFISDYFDLAFYLDAEEACLEHWYINRFVTLCKEARSDPTRYHHMFRQLTSAQLLGEAEKRWREINLANLRSHIAPTRHRADIILHKADDHKIDSVAISHRLF